MINQEKRIINCHTHLFTSDCVPPKLSRKMIFWPFSALLTVPLIIGIVKFWNKNRKYSPHHIKHKTWYKSLRLYIFQLRNVRIFNFLWLFIKYYLILHIVLLVFHDYIKDGLAYITFKYFSFSGAYQYMIKKKLIFPEVSGFYKWLFILIMSLFSKDVRTTLIRSASWAGRVGRLIPDSDKLKYLKRYFSIGRFAIHEKQTTIFSDLRNQYKTGTAFVVLPMDMNYMGAGEVSYKGNYYNQMSELLELKKKNENILYPFVFIDPRRIRDEKESFLSMVCNENTGKVSLNDCFVKKYIEQENFKGFKIYPALGYYPFDEDLLLLWKYAADNAIPIMSHVIRGTIFYRGAKKKEWDYHPVFNTSEKEARPLPLYEQKNAKFSANFTHPLNYLCLLEEKLLRKLVAKSNVLVKSTFGFTDEKTPMKHNLSQLKICFAHYGGDDEWQRYFDSDKDNYTHNIISNPTRGIEFLKNNNHQYVETKIEQIWRYVDWYSIITSLLLQYPNTYADISYILNNEKIYPLLKSSLTNPILRKKILFGTDFYVVRNHKTEKQLIAELMMYLGDSDFEQIACDNPKMYLGI